MNIDLHSTLGALADGGERRTAPTEELLARVHRRRAARAATTGAVAIGTVAAVAVGAVALSGRPTTRHDPAVEPGPSTTYVPDGSGFTCGGFAPRDAITEASGIRWDADLPNTWLEGDLLPVTARLERTDDTARLTSASMMVALLSDGRVVAIGGVPVDAGTDGLAPFAAPVTVGALVEPCGDDRLAPGEYTLVATLLYDFDDARSGDLQVSAPLTVTAWPTSDGLEAEREAAVADILAAAADTVARAPGTCASSIAPTPVGDAPIRADVTMTYDARFPRPQSYVGHGGIENVGAGPLTVDALPDGSRMVLTRDGVVVGVGERASWQGALTGMAMGPGESWGLWPVQTLHVCDLEGAGASQTDLPADDYEAWYVVTADVTAQDGAAAGTPQRVTVISEPLDVTLH